MHLTFAGRQIKASSPREGSTPRQDGGRRMLDDIFGLLFETVFLSRLALFPGAKPCPRIGANALMLQVWITNTRYLSLVILSTRRRTVI
jgi:hypothetical protein